MFKVIKIQRSEIALALLALAGIAFCVLGFGGLTERLAHWRNQPATSVTLPKEAAPESSKTLGGGTPVHYALPDTPAPVANQPATPNSGSANSDSAYFVEYRMERERARGIEMETMREVLASADADAETRKTANERLLNISGSIAKEIELESLIRAQGYSDAAVFLDGQTVTVVVQEGDVPVSADEQKAIVAMISKNTGVNQENIILIARPASQSQASLAP